MMGGFYTLFYKEILRFWRVAFQTVAAPVLTALLYLMIFRMRCRAMWMCFRRGLYGVLIPGLVMMSMLQNAFANTSSSLIQSKSPAISCFAAAALVAPGFFTAYVLAAVVPGGGGWGVFAVTLWFDRRR